MAIDYSGFLTVDGVCRRIGEWARDIGMTRRGLRRRIVRGWSLDRAVRERPLCLFLGRYVCGKIGDETYSEDGL